MPLRSTFATILALALRPVYPLATRGARLWYEACARAKIRGAVEPGVQFVGPITVDGEGQIQIKAGTRIGRNVVLETYNGAVINIGPQVTINDGCVICAYHGVSIGGHTMIGEYVSVRDANHGTAPDVYIHDQQHQGASIEIGIDCWLGRGVYVGQGVTIEDGAVIGANSVVTKSVKCGKIYVGNPLRFVRNRADVRDLS